MGTIFFSFFFSPFSPLRTTKNMAKRVNMMTMADYGRMEEDFENKKDQPKHLTFSHNRKELLFCFAFFLSVKRKGHLLYVDITMVTSTA